MNRTKKHYHSPPNPHIFTLSPSIYIFDIVTFGSFPFEQSEINRLFIEICASNFFVKLELLIATVVNIVQERAVL